MKNDDRGLIASHCGQLVNRVFEGKEGDAVRAKSKQHKKIVLNTRTLFGLELLAGVGLTF